MTKCPCRSERGTVIETIVASLALKGGSRMLRAAIESRNLGPEDASEMAVTVLEAIIAGQGKAATDLQRLEQKVDEMREDPYHAAMTSGANLLRDTALPHRRLADRQRTLESAQHMFSDAIGHARSHPVDLARAHTMYGLTWLALGEPRDLTTSLTRAIRILQQEVLTAFQLMCEWERDQERRRGAPATRFRKAIFGPDIIADWAVSNRWRQAQTEHEAVWMLYVMSHETCPYPRLKLPHGSAYSHPRPGLPVYATVSKPHRLLDADLTLGPADLTVANHGATLVRAELVTPVMDAEVVSPDVSALDRGGTLVHPGEAAQLRYEGGGRPAACLRLGRIDQVDLLVLMHTSWPGLMRGPLT